jgi:hypothetical protein
MYRLTLGALTLWAVGVLALILSGTGNPEP